MLVPRAENRAYLELGEDLKIMGIRHPGAVTLALACAFVDRYVTGVDEDLDRRSRLEALAGDAARRLLGREVAVEVSTDDDPGSGQLCLTTTGTSAEGVVEEFPEVAPACCGSVSQIRSPVRVPRLADVEVQAMGGWPPIELGLRIEQVIHDQLRWLESMWQGRENRARDSVGS